MLASPSSSPQHASRFQQTIQQIVDLRGRGLFTSQNVRIRFLPAEINTGIRFQRIDLPGRPVINAELKNLAADARHTVLVQNSARVETVEHVLSALAGAGIDNCLVQLNTSEPPNCDGSSIEFSRLLLTAQPVTQQAYRQIFSPSEIIKVTHPSGAFIEYSPAPSNSGSYLRIDYHLKYGPASGIPEHSVIYSHTPENFMNEIAPARTFIEEHEINYLRSQGFGKLTTNRDLLVINKAGIVLGNNLRYEDECARHKILDLLGDSSLSGYTLSGHIKAFMSGHTLNYQLAKSIVESASLQQHRLDAA